MTTPGEARLDLDPIIDRFTGLLDKVAWNEALDQRIVDAETTSGDAFGVIYLDVTGMKKINDNFGHESGDNFIRDVADMLGSKLRVDGDKPDLIANQALAENSPFTSGRVGGDEFAILVDLNPKSEHDNHRDIERRNTVETAKDRLDIIINRRLSKQIDLLLLRQPKEFNDLAVNIALGGAVWQKGATATELKSEADFAMLDSKRTQYDRLEIPRYLRPIRKIGRKLLKLSGVDERLIP